MERGGAVYIISNKTRSVLYIGVTSNLPSRIQEHQNKTHQGFTAKYNCVHLLHYENFTSIEEAIQREKQLKNWKRKWKDELTLKFNRNLMNLSSQILK